MLITNSRITSFATCPRKHHLAYTLRLRPVAKPYPLRFGTLVHLGLEAWWKETAHPHMRLARAANAIAEACEQSEDYDEWDLIKAQELINGYNARWSSEEWETIAVEKEFRLPLFGQVQLGGKMDALAKRDGELFVVEHKTSSEDISPGSDYWQRLPLDSQVSTYLRAAKELGHDGIRGCMYDVLHTVALKPYKAGKTRKEDETPEEYRLRVRTDIAERPDFYYQRGTVVRTEREAAEAEADLLEWSKAIVAGGCQRNTKACKTVLGACSYIGICQGTESANDTLKYRVAEEENEELASSA